MHIETLPGLLAYWKNAFPDCLIHEWTGEASRSLTSVQFSERVNWMYQLLTRDGVVPGIRVGVLHTASSLELLALNFALHKIGAVCCPIHGHFSDDDIRHVTLQCDLSAIYAADDDSAARITAACSGSRCRIASISSWQYSSYVEISRVAHPEPDEPALIMLSSGSSGRPKGILLSHRGLISNALSCTAASPVSQKHVVMSFLPVSHIFERVALLTYMLAGAEIHLVSTPNLVMQLTPEISPHFFTTVPRQLEEINIRFLSALRGSNYFVREAYDWALARSTRPSGLRRVIARRFLLSRFRRQLGRRLKGIIVGAAPVDERLIHWYRVAGIQIREGYGLTEAGGVVAFNRFTPGGNRPGSAGLPLPGVEVDISGEPGEPGEVLVRSSSVMLAYAGTADNPTGAIDETGWLHTGDLGYLDSNGFLFITGRQSEVIKTSTGEFIVPPEIETRLSRQVSVQYAAVIAYRKPFVSALIKPDERFLEEWCRENDIHWTSIEYMVHNPEVKRFYQNIIETANRDLKSYEQIRDFRLVAGQWSTKNGLLTSTFKIKRDAVFERYSKTISEIYE